VVVDSGAECLPKCGIRRLLRDAQIGERLRSLGAVRPRNPSLTRPERSCGARGAERGDLERQTLETAAKIRLPAGRGSGTRSIASKRCHRTANVPAWLPPTLCRNGRRYKNPSTCQDASLPHVRLSVIDRNPAAHRYTLGRPGTSGLSLWGMADGPSLDYDLRERRSDKRRRLRQWRIYESAYAFRSADAR